LLCPQGIALQNKQQGGKTKNQLFCFSALVFQNAGLIESAFSIIPESSFHKNRKTVILMTNWRIDAKKPPCGISANR